MITISVVAYIYGNELGTGMRATIKDPSSPILVLFRDLMTGVLLGYIPYIFFGWSKKTRPIAIYLCLIWVLFYAYAKFLM